MKKRIKRKNAKQKRLELENEKYREIIEELQSKIKYDKYLFEENRKLIDWVQKILKEFGTYDVNQRERISIPIYKRGNFYYDNARNCEMRSTTLVIPEIVINKMEAFDETTI